MRNPVRKSFTAFIVAVLTILSMEAILRILRPIPVIEENQSPALMEYHKLLEYRLRPMSKLAGLKNKTVARA